MSRLVPNLESSFLLAWSECANERVLRESGGGLVDGDGEWHQFAKLFASMAASL